MAPPADLAQPPVAPPIVLGGGAVTFASPYVLAPMEGVTHRAFRDVVLALGGVGAAWTEFVRVSAHALKPKVLARELGPPRRNPPVGLQLMAVDPAKLAETARNAALAGAPMVDLNFGCPAPVVFDKCAGSALLEHPDRVAALTAAAVAAAGVPVTVKVRLGVRDPGKLRAIVEGVAAAGAAALTVHARTRVDGYAHPARWDELAKVRAWTRLPLVGNGDVLTVADARRMIDRCGVDAVMIGRGVLRDPWIFARLRAADAGLPEPRVGPSEVLAFHRGYRDAMRALGSERGCLSNLKQWWRRLDVGAPPSEEDRRALLRAPTLAEFDAGVLRLTSEAPRTVA